MEFNSEEEWLAYEESRGELAMRPETLHCTRCGTDQAVVALGPIVEARRDPTETLVLACGHTEI